MSKVVDVSTLKAHICCFLDLENGFNEYSPKKRRKLKLSAFNKPLGFLKAQILMLIFEMGTDE